jgi:hypothetical protein
MSVLSPYRNNLFASRDTIEEALDYCTMVASGCGENHGVVLTAIMVLINTVCKLEETSE